MNNLHPTSQVTEAVHHAPTGVDLSRFKLSVQIPYLGWILAGVVSLSVAALTVMLLSNNGDWALLNQRLFGQVQLTTGTYAAKSVSDLNRLSWQWGLDTMDTMDALETELTATEAVLTQVSVSASELKRAERKLLVAEARLNTHLSDKAKLIRVAQVLGQDQLYAPEYSDSLFELQSRLAEVKTRLAQARS